MMTTGAVLAATGALFLNPLTASAHCEWNKLKINRNYSYIRGLNAIKNYMKQ